MLLNGYTCTSDAAQHDHLQMDIHLGCCWLKRARFGLEGPASGVPDMLTIDVSLGLYVDYAELKCIQVEHSYCRTTRKRDRVD
jgi:hypothetical protein